jgi:hypothetical protein
MSETWTPKEAASEAWTSLRIVRAFDHRFDNAPSFDTGSAAGIWTARSAQSETWTEVE